MQRKPEFILAAIFGETNRLKVQVRGGTIDGSGESLCKTCTRFVEVKDARSNKVFRDCSFISFRPHIMPEVVASCTSYSDARIPSLNDMKAIAWEIKGDPKKKIGFAFVPPDKQEQYHKRVARWADVGDPYAD